MYPHVGNILGGNIVSKPFMTAFMNNDEVPVQTLTSSTEVATHIPFFELVPIGDSTLMLHAQVWRLYDFIPIVVKRVGTKPVFKSF